MNSTKRQNMYFEGLRKIKISLIVLFMGITLLCKTSFGQENSPDDTLKRQSLLKEILELLPKDITGNGWISYQDKTFQDWLDRTGELPPDFDKMPSIPFLPNPLIEDEGGKNIPIQTKEEWKQQRTRLKEQLQYYITGTFPPPPDNLQSEILSEKMDGEVTIRRVELSFGPQHKAKMTLELLIPPGSGPFPVFMTQWNHKDWASIALRRGYIGCIYAGADMKDDTENYGEIWDGKYDFTRIMRRAFGAFRVIDYLYTLPEINKEQIALSGHSRNGKQSLWAAAFDERINAVITSSGGSGGEVPWRYSGHKYGGEDIALLSTAQPAWLHPRLRFFIGRENKLPVDQNSFMALVAPRGLLLSSSRRESDSNPWGIEQAFDSTRKVYGFTGEPDHIAVRLRDGKHGTSSRDIEDYIDFFDFVFDRTDKKPENKTYYNYSFEKWKGLSGEDLDLSEYPKKTKETSFMEHMESVGEWEKKKTEINKNIQWSLGDEPAGIVNKGPKDYAHSKTSGEEYFGNMVPRPQEKDGLGRVTIAPGGGLPGFGDYLYGYMYYPKKYEEEIKKGAVKLPAVVYLHKYDYSHGFYDNQGFDHNQMGFLKKLVDKGYVVLMYDMIGFANRIEEGTAFYDRYPHWSKMGKMVSDLKGAVDALTHLDFIDEQQISVLGYTLGATVGLYGASQDERISRVISISGFTPLRSSSEDKGVEGIRAFSHLHGLQPRLGFFVGHEDQLPYDFDEVMAGIAPRSLRIIAPEWDKDAVLPDVEQAVQNAKKIYGLYGEEHNIELYVPQDYSRFSQVMREKVLEWLPDNTKAIESQKNKDLNWDVLFDGKNVEKWSSPGIDTFPSSSWKVEDGTLTMTKGGSDLMTKARYKDFELYFEFKLTENANSGIKYFVDEIKEIKTGKKLWNGLEYQIIDDFNHPAVANHKNDLGSTAALYLIYEPVHKELKPVGEWNTGKIISRGDRVEHWLNGRKVVTYTRGNVSFRQRILQTKFKEYQWYGEKKEGHIILQNHNGEQVFYKNIKIRDL